MKAKAADKYNWRRAVICLGFAFSAIGVWVFLLGSVAVSTYTRDSIVLSTPTNQALLAATLFMLIGLVLMAIQVVGILEHFIGTHETNH